jgi:putative inorganic carbon (HCO3(-)) transporter
VPRRARARSAVPLYLLLVGWTAFAFAGVYAWTLYLPAVICLWLALDGRPWGAPDERSLLLDCSLALVAGALILQLVPLPAAVADAMSPALRPTRERIFLRLPSWLPVTIDPRSGAWAAMVGIGTLVIFLTARRLLNSSGVRMFVRGLTAIGLVLSAIGLAQDTSGQGLMYWHTAPLQEGAPPFGPFVDRNSFATWVLLAMPLCSGYLVAHLHAHRRDAHPESRWRARVREALDARAIFIAVSVSVMMIALLATLSRSGMVSMAVVIGLGTYLGGRRGTAGRLGRSWLVAVGAIVLLLAMSRIDPVVLGRRFASARTSAADRLVIWRETLPIVRDFWLTGTGAGTYETAMLVYQRSSPGVRFNQAHNHYLQLASEGGVLLGVPVLLSLVAYGFVAAKRVAADASSMYWVRAGALCALVGVAVQSVWDTGLTAPANATLAALAAAIAVYPADDHREAAR